MPVPLVPCRHRENGTEALIPETALYLFGDYERTDQDDTEAAADGPAAQDGEPADTAKDTTEQPAPPGRRTSKAATSAATKED